jgi:hypothetical protein
MKMFHVSFYDERLSKGKEEGNVTLRGQSEGYDMSEQQAAMG